MRFPSFALKALIGYIYEVNEPKIMPEEIEKYKQAWKMFRNKMASLRIKRFEILENISKKFDQQQIEKIRKKLGTYE